MPYLPDVCCHDLYIHTSRRLVCKPFLTAWHEAGYGKRSIAGLYLVQVQLQPLPAKASLSIPSL